MMGNLKRLQSILLNQKDRHPFSVDSLNDLENFLDDLRRQAQTRLVKQQKLWLTQQCSRNRHQITSPHFAGGAP